MIHYGAESTRVKKCEVVADSDVALRYLRVCPISTTVENCESCEKCLRTMTALEVLGLLDRCRTFQGALDIDAIGRVFLRGDNQRLFFRELRGIAVARGRHDIAAAIDRSLLRSTLARPWMAVTARLGQMPPLEVRKDRCEHKGLP